MSDAAETAEAERPARTPMDIGQVIVDCAKPVLHAAGYAYEGPLAAEKWTRTPDGNWIVLLKLGIGGRYAHLRATTLYHPRVGDYFHSRETAEKVYAEATRVPHAEPPGPHERFPSPEAKAAYERGWPPSSRRGVAAGARAGRRLDCVPAFRPRAIAPDRDRRSAAYGGLHVQSLPPLPFGTATILVDHQAVSTGDRSRQ